MQTQTSDDNHNDGPQPTAIASPKPAHRSDAEADLDAGYFDDGSLHDDLEFDPSECLPNPDLWKIGLEHELTEHELTEDELTEDELTEDELTEDELTEDDIIEIRKFDGGRYFRVHNWLLEKDGLGAQIGPYGIAVYCAIARHADHKTQQAYPSFNTIARETGISRSKVIATVRQLEVIGLLKCQPRYNQETKGQSSNLITLLGERHVQNDAVAKLGQAQNVRKVAQRASDTREGNPKRVDGARNSSQRTALGSSQDIRGVVHKAEGGSVSGGLDPVQVANSPRPHSAPKQHSGRNIQKEEDETTQTHHHRSELTDGNGLQGILSSALWIQEKRMPILPEWNQLKRAMARELLQMVAPDFDGPERYIEGLNAERLERLGTCLIVLLDSSKQQLLNRLNNPAGFVRSIMVDDYWLKMNAGSMSHVWEGLCQWFARCCWKRIPKDVLLDWFDEKVLHPDLLNVFIRAGVTFAEESRGTWYRDRDDRIMTDKVDGPDESAGDGEVEHEECPF